MKKYLLSALLTASLPLLMVAQMSYGFKTGLNFSTFGGPLELDDAGMEVEEYDNNTGFHIAATVGYKLTDFFGVRGEFMFNQRGARYRYNGQSYRIMVLNTGGTAVTTGNTQQSINITTSYIDIPLMAYVKPVKWLEIHGGVSGSFLTSASGIGELIYTDGVSPLGNPIDRVQYNLQYSYQSDVVDEPFSPASAVFVDGVEVLYPNTATTFFDYFEYEGKWFSGIDFGLVGGASLFINNGLYISGRFYYGLNDITNDAYDRSQVRLNADGSFIDRNDTDRHLSTQVSVGFNF